MSGRRLWVRLAVFITVIALAVLMIAAAVGPYFVPTKTYQRAVEGALAERLDARVVIDNFRLRLIPYPGYTIEGFALISDRAPFRGMPIVEAKKVKGSLSFGALFGGDFDTEVEARDVNINIRSQGGANNVEMMFGGGSALTDSGLPPEPAPEDEAPRPAVPDAPLETIPAMPAPSIEVPEGGESGFLRELIIREAHAAGDGADARSVTLSRFDIVRGRVEITSDESPAPVVVEGVSMAAKDLSLEGGFSGSFKMTGTIVGESPARLSVQGGLILDEGRRELTLRNARILFGNTQFIIDATLGYGMKPASIDAHVASPNVTSASLVPALAYMGLRIPSFVSWDGMIGIDISYRGTRQAGQMGLQFDATPARVRLGEGFLKEPGLPFKVQTDIIVKPESLIIGEGTLSLEGSEIRLSGDAMRSGDMEVRLGARGDGMAPPALRSLLPWLPDLDSAEGARVDLTFGGAIFGQEGLSSSGRLDASKISLAGISVSDLSAMFTREDEGVEITTVRGSFAGGELSGHGRVNLGEEPGFEFDIVMGGVDAKELVSLKGAVGGKASMVIKAKSSGKDRAALEENFAVSGSFVATDATIQGIDSAAGAFSEGTWEAISEKAAATLSESAKKELEESSDAVADLKASFEMGEDGLTFDSLSWVSKLYSAELSASSDSAGELSAKGSIVVDKPITSKLIAEGPARSKLTDTKGRLVIPVKGEGSIDEPKLSIDEEELVAIIEGRTKPKPMLDIVKKEAKEKPAAAGEIKALEAPGIDMAAPPTTVIDAPITEEKKAAAKAPSRQRASTPKVRREAPARGSEPGMPDQEVDDILKVIIGN